MASDLGRIIYVIAAVLVTDRAISVFPLAALAGLVGGVVLIDWWASLRARTDSDRQAPTPAPSP